MGIFLKCNSSDNVSVITSILEARRVVPAKRFLVLQRQKSQDLLFYDMAQLNLIFICYLFPGMTSEGGGAVAFPVMTLAFGTSPAVARDFSLMIQSCGMSAAAFTIFFMRVGLTLVP